MTNWQFSRLGGWQAMQCAVMVVALNSLLPSCATAQSVNPEATDSAVGAIPPADAFNPADVLDQADATDQAEVLDQADGNAPAGSPQVGDELNRIQCPDGFEARVFATKLNSPDGLSFDQNGGVCVAEESAGRIIRIGTKGKHEVIASRLRSPEGICLAKDGSFFVVEDVADGRLLMVNEKGKREVLAEKLNAPEGVTLLGNNIYWTESTVQLTENILTAKTWVKSLRRGKRGWEGPFSILEKGMPFSFSEIVAEDSDHLILANEIGSAIVSSSLMRYNLKSGELRVFAKGLINPEGLCMTPGKSPKFPLYVAEESIDAQDHGRISWVDATGKRTTFATGFGSIEDVLVGADGRIFVSEDSTGLIIELRPSPR